MNMNRVVLIIPGFKDYPNLKIYRQISKSYQDKGFDVVVLNIPWKNHTMSDYVDYFLKIYFKYQDSEVSTLGFSFGAMVSFIASSKVNIKSQILCSISPYFKEDMKLIKKSWADGVGKKRMADFGKISRKEICKLIKAQTTMLIGTKEGPEMLQVTQSIYDGIKSDKDLAVIKGVGHDIAAKKYFEEISKRIKLL